MMISSGNPRQDFARAVLESMRGNEDESAKRLELARSADPTALPLVQRAVDQKLKSGDRLGAVELYRQLAEARQDDLDIQLGYVDFLQARGSGDSIARGQSIKILNESLAKHPGNPDIVERLFRLAGADADKSRQVELLEMLSSDEPQSAILYATLTKSISNEDDERALSRIDERFLTSMEKSPRSPMLAREASEHFRSSGRLDEAIRMLALHVKASPSSLDLRVRLGILCFSAKRDQEGEKALKEVLEIHPGKALAHQSLAKFYRLRGNVPMARIHAAEVLKIRGGTRSEFLNLAQEWLDAGEPRQARLLLEKGVFDFPDSSQLAAKLAIATHRDPETRELAMRLFKEAEESLAEENSKDPEFLIAAAEALITQGQGQAAEEKLRTAIRLYPPEAKKETAAALRRLAALWESENRNAEAARSLRQRADSLDR